MTATKQASNARIIKRLKRSRELDLESVREFGVESGRAWAADEASFSEVLLVLQWEDCPANLPNAVESLRGLLTEWGEGDESGRLALTYSHEFWESFEEGVGLLWEQIEDAFEGE